MNFRDFLKKVDDVEREEPAAEAPAEEPTTEEPEQESDT